MSAIPITGAGDVIDNIGPQTLLDLIGLFDGYGLVVTDDELLTRRLDELQEERDKPDRALFLRVVVDANCDTSALYDAIGDIEGVTDVDYVNEEEA